MPAEAPSNESMFSQFNVLGWVTPPKVRFIEEQLTSIQNRTVDAAIAWEIKSDRVNSVTNITLKAVFLNIMNFSVIVKYQNS